VGKNIPIFILIICRYHAISHKTGENGSLVIGGVVKSEKPEGVIFMSSLRDSDDVFHAFSVIYQSFGVA